MTETLRAFGRYCLDLRKRRAIETDWAARHRKVFRLNPGYANPCPPEAEREHIALWRRLRSTIRTDTLRICYNISGKLDVRTVPEEIFAWDVERCLNPGSWAKSIGHKSFYDRLYPTDIFPLSFLHRIDGVCYDPTFNVIPRESVEDVARTLPYPVIIKPNWDSSGGAGVCAATSASHLLTELASRKDCVVQETLPQHQFFRKFNPHGINSIRLYTYRSFVSGQVYILNAALRMGKSGSLDNETAGGIVCYFDTTGRLNDYAVDKYGCKFFTHPDTGIIFAKAGNIPLLDGLSDLALSLANRTPLRVAGWDFCLDSAGRWRCLEVNVQGHTIRFSQYAGVSFFGDLTEEVIAHCATPR